MRKIEHAGHWIDVTPFVEEAVERLGFFRRDSAPYLADGVATFFNHGKIGYELRRGGEELTDTEKLEIGLQKRVRMSREYWTALAETGRVEPVKGPEIVFQRIVSNLYKEGKRRQLDESYKRSQGDFGEDFWSHVLLRTVENRCCSASEHLSGTLIRTPDRPKLPLTECDRDVCQCYYDVSTARKMRREESEHERTSVATTRTGRVKEERDRGGILRRLFGWR